MVADRGPLEQHATSGERTEGNWSLAGAQPKFALAWDRDRWVRPTGVTATTNIFEPNTSGFVHFDVNKFLCLGTARHPGLPAAGAQVLEFEDERVLVVQRYDRSDTNARIHQEDLGRAVGVIRNGSTRTIRVQAWRAYESGSTRGSTLTRATLSLTSSCEL